MPSSRDGLAVDALAAGGLGAVWGEGVRCAAVRYYYYMYIPVDSVVKDVIFVLQKRLDSESEVLGLLSKI